MKVENLNCLSNESFNEVVKKIIIHASKIKIKNNNEEYEILYMKENKALVFKQKNYSIGRITANLDVYALAKRYQDNQNQKLKINEIFCDLFDWSQGKLNIFID